MKIQQSINVFTFETSEKWNNFQPYLWIWYFTSQNKRLENNMRRFQNVGLPNHKQRYGRWTPTLNTNNLEIQKAFIITDLIINDG